MSLAALHREWEAMQHDFPNSLMGRNEIIRSLLAEADRLAAENARMKETLTNVVKAFEKNGPHYQCVAEARAVLAERPQ